MTANNYIPKRAMAITAHPDDIEFSAAGTIAKWVRSGTVAAYVLCTSGEVGIATPGMTKQKACQIREKEARNAANTIGVQDIVFLREPDGLLEPTIELRKKIVREIRRFKPEVIFCTDPTIVWSNNKRVNHPDHRAAGLAALDAIFPAAGQPNLFEELEEESLFAHKPRKIYVTGWHQSDLFINIDETFQLKIKSLKEHKSQMDGFDPEDYLTKRCSESAKGKEMSYAEPFRVIELMDDTEWAKYNNHG